MGHKNLEEIRTQLICKNQFSEGDEGKRGQMAKLAIKVLGAQVRSIGMVVAFYRGYWSAREKHVVAFAGGRSL
jgi:predicted secreted protein